MLKMWGFSFHYMCLIAFQGNTTRNFNEEFQNAPNSISDETVLNESDNFVRLADLGRDFLQTAQSYAQIIIREKFLRFGFFPV